MALRWLSEERDLVTGNREVGELNLSTSFFSVKFFAETCLCSVFFSCDVISGRTCYVNSQYDLEEKENYVDVCVCMCVCVCVLFPDVV